MDKEVNIGQLLNNIFQSFRLHFSGRPRLIEAALQESATLSATLIDKLWHLWHTFLFCHERHTFVAPINLISVASIHERPIFGSLATNLGITFKAPTNLGALAPGLFPSFLQLSLTLVPDPQASQGGRSFELSRLKRIETD